MFVYFDRIRGVVQDNDGGRVYVRQELKSEPLLKNHMVHAMVIITIVLAWKISYAFLMNPSVEPACKY